MYGKKHSQMGCFATAGFVALALLVVGGVVALSGLLWLFLWNVVVHSLFPQTTLIDLWLGMGISVLVGTVGSAFRGVSGKSK